MPVLYGTRGKTVRSFQADAYSAAERYVVEVEAGRAVVNYQFLKDLFQACVMSDVDYFGLAVRNVYKSSKDFRKGLRLPRHLIHKWSFSASAKGNSPDRVLEVLHV